MPLKDQWQYFLDQYWSKDKGWRVKKYWYIYFGSVIIHATMPLWVSGLVLRSDASPEDWAHWRLFIVFMQLALYEYFLVGYLVARAFAALIAWAVERKWQKF